MTKVGWVPGCPRKPMDLCPEALAYLLVVRCPHIVPVLTVKKIQTSSTKYKVSVLLTSKRANKFIDSLRSLNSKKYPAKVPLKIDHSLYFTVGLGINPCPTCKAGNGSRVVAGINNVTFVMPTTALLQAHYFKTKGVFTTDFPANPPISFNFWKTAHKPGYN